jgi:predicted ATPase/DNA-binding SARP family transcriptional activator
MRYLPAAWRLELFGWLHAHNDEGSVITRFQTHQTGALLAYLALHPNRSHTRDELGDILWPDADVESMRHRFRQALSALRKQLELPGTPHGSIIAADRWSVRLNMDAVSTDVAAFEETLAQAAQAQGPKEKMSLLLRAAELYRGDLLPGYYEDCFTAERERLADCYIHLLSSLVRALRDSGEPVRAIEYAKRLIERDSLREDSYLDLMRLYEGVGERSSAMRLFQQLRQVLEDEIGEEPSKTAQDLYDEILKSPKVAYPMSDLAKPVRTPKVGKASKASTSPERPRLPMQFTRFFGRADELRQITDLLAGRAARILTVIGMGGVGKTRVAIQAAEAGKSIFGDNVYFALLAPIEDPAYIGDAILKALGLKRIAGMSPSQQIAKHLNQFPRVLLVLDNFEHLLGGTSEVRELLSEVPGLQCLITSRRRLNLEGEHLLHLTPLPPPGDSWTAADLLKTPRTQILVDRAQAVMPDFQVTERNAQTIAEICDRLEGIPLAIELAAAWARILSPSQMLDQLSSKFDLLVSKRPDIHERHRTLRAALDYTYSLLKPEIQQFFLSLSIFRGGWTLEAASYVCGIPNAMNALDELLDWSLIVSEGMDMPEASDIRCGMLDTIQEYAGEKLHQDAREELATRRYEYFQSLIQRAGTELAGRGFKSAIHRLDTETPNISACLRWCEEKGMASEGLAMSQAMMPYWILRAQLSEARAWLLKFTQMPCSKEGHAAFIEGRYSLGRLAMLQGDYLAAMEAYRACVKDYSRLSDTAGVAKAMNQVGFCEREQGMIESACRKHEESLRLAREAGDKSIVGSALANLGTIAAKQGNLVKVVELFEESLGICRELGDPVLLSITLNNYGFSLLLMDDFADAEPHITESLEILNDLGLQATITARINLSYIHLLKGDLEPAKALLRDTLLESSRYELRRQLYCCLGQTSMIARKEHRYEQSAVLLYAMLSLSQVLGLHSDDPYLRMAEEANNEFRQVLSPVAYALANARGRAIPTKELVEFALANCLDVATPKSA